MQHGWLGKPSHPFMSACHPFMPARVASSAVQAGKVQFKQTKRPALAHIYTIPFAHLHPKSSVAGPHLHPKSSVAYENTRLNYREGTILPVFACACLRRLCLPAPACICLFRRGCRWPPSGPNSWAPKWHLKKPSAAPGQSVPTPVHRAYLKPDARR